MFNRPVNVYKSHIPHRLKGHKTQPQCENSDAAEIPDGANLGYECTPACEAICRYFSSEKKNLIREYCNKRNMHYIQHAYNFKV